MELTFKAKARAGWRKITISNSVLTLKRFGQEENIPLSTITNVTVFKAMYDLPLLEKSVQLFTQGRKILIKRMKRQKANELKEIILKSQNPIPAPTALSSADEIEKLATLREKNIITEEEFDNKKKQILES